MVSWAVAHGFCASAKSKDDQRSGLRMTKKILISGAILLGLSFVLVPWKPNEIRTFLWHQPIAKSDSLAGWKLYQSTTSGGPYTLIQTIPFKTAQNEYEASVSLRIPPGRVKTLYFVLTAFKTSGMESKYSNEASLTLDIETRLWGYDFIWAGKRNMTLNYFRLILQSIAIVLGTFIGWFMTSGKRGSSLPSSSQAGEEGKRFFCETCKKDLPNANAAEVHRAFKHEVRDAA